jgi:hypothetical protein
MNKKRLVGGMVALVFAAFVMIPLQGLATDSVTIQGEVSESNQIVHSDGQVFEIADTEAGNDLADNFIGEKVKVTGTVEKDGDVQVITVMSFETMAE